MFPSLLLITEFSKSFLLQEIPILEEKILIKELWNISLNKSKRSIMLILEETKELFKNLKEKLKKLKELYHLPTKLNSKSKPSMKELISLKY
jgi:hypothetical protein